LAESGSEEYFVQSCHFFPIIFVSSHRTKMGFTTLTVLTVYFTAAAFASPTEECQPRNVTYFISDSEQCDKYYECLKSGKGKVNERLCEDGFAFSESYHHCDYPHNVDCTRRPNLQPPTVTRDKNCIRANGFYPFPPSVSCQKFYHCLEGVAYEKTCPEGIIFDKGTCVHPDMSARPDCAAHTVLDFKCPNMNERFARLRFGDHDRHAHPKDCRKFFICLMDGKPRMGGCPLGKVFNDKTGFCDSPKNVVNCQDYYGKKTMAELKKQQAVLEGVEDIEGISSEEDSSMEEKLQKNSSKCKQPAEAVQFPKEKQHSLSRPQCQDCQGIEHT